MTSEHIYPQPRLRSNCLIWAKSIRGKMFSYLSTFLICDPYKMKPGKIVKQTPLAVGFWPEKKISNPAFVLSCGNNFTYTYIFKTAQKYTDFEQITYTYVQNLWVQEIVHFLPQKLTFEKLLTRACKDDERTPNEPLFHRGTLKRITVHAVIFLQLNISQKSSTFPLFQLFRPTFFQNCPTARWRLV